VEDFLKKRITFLSFLLIPGVYFWHPNWLEFLGVQPYWPLFWLLPWSIIHGSIDGLIAGLFIGLILDSISPDSSFTQIPGLVFCGIWFGRFSISRNVLVGHFRYGLICSIASFFCSSLYFSQILIKNLSEHSISLFIPSIKNIFAQVFITGLLSPLLCSLIFRIIKRPKEKNKFI